MTAKKLDGRPSWTDTKKSWQILPEAPYIGVVGKKKETVGDGINKAIRDLNAATFSGNVIPNIIKLEFDLRGKPVGH